MKSGSLWIGIIFACASCGGMDRQFTPEGSDGVGAEGSSYGWQFVGVTRRDVLIVLDDGVISGPYASRLEQGLRDMVRDLDYGTDLSRFGVGSYAPDFNFALVPAAVTSEIAGSLWPSSSSCATPSGAFLHASVLCDAPTNFQGTMVDAVVCAAMNMPVSGRKPRPLDTIRSFFAPGGLAENSGFRRKNAYFFIAIISTEDDPALTSAEDVAAWREFLGTLGESEELVMVGIAAPGTARGLSDLARAFGRNGTFTNIADDRWAALHWPGMMTRTPVHPCIDWPLADADPNTPGIQPDCVATERHWYADHFTEQLLPQCPYDGSIPSRCWRIDWDSHRCGPARPEFVVTWPAGACLPSYRITDGWTCLVQPK